MKSKGGTIMRNNFIKITLTLVLMFVMAVPAQVFALGNSPGG
jgi:hypothetical protein